MRPRRRFGAVLGSIRTRLAVFFFLITLIAVAVVYVYAVPSLQSRLERQQLTDLRKVTTHQTTVQTVARHLAAYVNELNHPAKAKTLKLPVLTYGEPLTRWERAIRHYTTEKKAAQAQYEEYQQRLRQEQTAAVASLSLLTGSYALTLYTFQRTANGGPGPGQQGISFSPNGDTTQAAPQAVHDAAQNAFTLREALFGPRKLDPRRRRAADQEHDLGARLQRELQGRAADVTLIRSRILVAAAIALPPCCCSGSSSRGR